MIVPFAAGGTPDVVARIIGQQLAARTGQPFVIENRPGADGIVGAQAVSEAPPDGYMLLVTSSSFVINPSFHKTLPFDVVRDFEPVTNISATEAFILGVNPKFPAQSVQELIALARKPESRISFASPGVGNVLHLAAELFKARTGAQDGACAIPRRGAGHHRTHRRRRRGHVPDAAGLAGPYRVREDPRARLYAPTRARTSSNVPTMAEAGVTNMDVVEAGPGCSRRHGRRPRSSRGCMRKCSNALALPAVRDRMIGLGLFPVGNPPAEFKPFVAAQVKNIADIVRSAGIEPH